MTTFVYSGFDRGGRRCRGLIEAADRKEARRRLAEREILGDKLDQAGDKAGGRRRGVFDAGVRSMVYRELAALIESGMPLANALKIMIETPEMGDARLLLARLRDRIAEGSSLGQALSGCCPAMLSHEIAALDAGEISGGMAAVLDGLADYLDRQQNLREQLHTALIYPVLVLLLAVVVAVLMLGVMLPRFERLFREARIELPLLTQWVLSWGRWFLAAAGLTAALLLLAGALGPRWLRARPDWMARIDRLSLRCPMLGAGRKLLINSRFARTLALLFRNGVSLVEGMDLAGRSTGSPSVRQAVLREAGEVRNGKDLTSAIRSVPVLGEHLPAWIGAGESSGRLGDMLERAAARYEQRWERLTTRLLEWLEPALILVVGLLVLVIALALLLPLLSLNEGLSAF